MADDLIFKNIFGDDDITDKDAPERRITDRVPIRLHVTYIVDNEKRIGYCSDISPLGMFIESFLIPPLKTMMKLIFEIPLETGNVEIRVTGAVVRLIDLKDAKIPYIVPGFGVHFFSFEGQGQELINDYVNKNTRLE